MKGEFDINTINGLFNDLIPTISDDNHFWMVRTNGGRYYKEFINNGFIALGWNLVDKTTAINKNTEKTLKAKLQLSYNEKRPGLALNKCKRFINDVQPGDYVIVPNRGSTEYAICKVKDYYEMGPEYDAEYELDESVREQKGFDPGLCPYKKRRHVDVISRVSARSVGYKLQKATSCYHGLSDMDDYAEDILSCVYDCYVKENSVYMAVNVSRTGRIPATDITELLDALVDLLEPITTDRKNISARVNINSPGKILFVIAKFLLDNKLQLIFLFCFLYGGGVGKHTFNGAIQTLHNLKKSKIMDELEIEEKKLDIKKKQQDYEIGEIEKRQKLLDLVESASKSNSFGEFSEENLNRLSRISKEMMLQDNETFSKIDDEEEDIPVYDDSIIEAGKDEEKG